jgi:hypothetical protein
MFCDLSEEDLSLHADSPCLPENNTWQVLIGAHGLGCGWRIPGDQLAVVDGVIWAEDDDAALLLNLRSQAIVTVAIYDLNGRLVSTPVDRQSLPAGRARRAWDLKDGSGMRVSSGTYFCVIKVGSDTVKKKIAILSR